MTFPAKQRTNPWLKRGCLISIGVISTLIGTVFLLDEFMPSTARRSLPESATDVQEHYSDSWNGDYVRCIKARLPEIDLPLYAKKLGLSERFDPAAHHDIANLIDISFDGPDWWTPPPATQTTYFGYERGDDFLQVLKYSSGYVYFVSTSW